MSETTVDPPFPVPVPAPVTSVAPAASLPAPLATAVRFGLLLTTPEARSPWTRLSCPECGGSLDVQADLDGVGRPAVARRVDAFVDRHRPGRTHR